MTKIDLGKLARADSGTTAPLSYRIDAGLKKVLDALATKLNKSVTDLTQDALRLYLSAICPNCNSIRARLVPGLGQAFEPWAAVHKREGVYLILREGERYVAYKGVLSYCDDRTVTLTPISRGTGGQERDGVFLREQLADWRPGDHGNDTSEFEKTRPTVTMSQWGLGR